MIAGGVGGFPAAHCGIVSTSKEWMKGRKRWSGAGTSTGQFLRDHWGSGLGSDSQHINLDPEAKREIGFL